MTYHDDPTKRPIQDEPEYFGMSALVIGAVAVVLIVGAIFWNLSANRSHVATGSPPTAGAPATTGSGATSPPARTAPAPAQPAPAQPAPSPSR